MIFEAGFSIICVDSMIPVLPVHSPACSDAPKWCWLTLVHLTCSSQHHIGSGLWKREKLCWLHDFKQKWHFCFSIMACSAGAYRESCGDNSEVFVGSPCPPLLHMLGHQTLPHTFWWWVFLWVLRSTCAFSLGVNMWMLGELLEYEAEALWAEPEVCQEHTLMLNVNVGLQMASLGFRHMKSSCCWAGFELSSTLEKLKLHQLDLGFVFVQRTTDCSFYDWQHFALKKTPSSHKVPGARCLGCDRFFLSYCFVYLIPAICISCISNCLICNDPALPWTFSAQPNKICLFLKRNFCFLLILSGGKKGI